MVMEKQIAMVSKENNGESTKRKGVGEKIGAFFDKNYALFFAPILVLAIYLMALYQYDVYPFGTGYTAASYDLSAQICPFIEHIFDVLDGKSSLTYTHALAGGVDVTGTFLYFFVSPFSFLFLIFGDGMVAHTAGIVMACKLATISVSGTWFAKKLFKNIPDYLCIAVGIVYTYCGYAFVASTYINWVDFLIYLPFCAAAFCHFVKTEKFLPFSILLACCVYTCFSIACFSMFTVFPALIAYAIFCVEKERRNRFIAYLCLSFVVVLLISLPILLPALGAVVGGARGGGLMEKLWKGYPADDPTRVFDSSWYIENYSTSLYQKLSYILSDSVFVVLTLVWFYRNGLKSPMAKFMLTAGVLTLLPVIVDESMLLLNMGSYYSYALRFGFLNALYFLGGACLALNEVCYKPLCAYDGVPLFERKKTDERETTEKEKNDVDRYATNAKKQINVWGGIMLGIGAVCAAFLLYFIVNDNYIGEKFWGIFFSDSSSLKAMSGFSPSFAHSLGGLEVILILFIVVGLATAVGCCFVGSKKISPRLLSYVLIVVVGLQVLFYNNQMVLGNRTDQQVKMSDYQTLSARLNEMETGEYFRLKDHNDKWTSDVPLSGDSNAFSVFSSVIDKDNFITRPLFGYKLNDKNNYKSSHDTGRNKRSELFGDSFLGYKYFIVAKSEQEKFEDDKNYKNYLKPVMVANESGEEIQLSSGDYVIYENTVVFPNAYTVDGEAFRFVRENIASGTDSNGNAAQDNRKLNQAALYQFLRGETLENMKLGESSTQWTVSPKNVAELSEYLWTRAAESIEVGAGEIVVRVANAKAGENLFLSFVASKGYTVTVNGRKAELIDNDLKFLSVALEEGENVVKFSYSSPYLKHIAIGAVGAVVSLCIVALIVKKTKFMKMASFVIAWAGIGVAVVVVAFFMLYPTSAWIVKLLNMAFPTL